MDFKGVYVNLLLDSILPISALADTGCSSFAVISERVVQKHQLDTVRISLEQVTGVQDNATHEVAWLHIDMDGFEDRVLAYVIPGQKEDLILGAAWLAKHEAMVDVANQRLVMPHLGIYLGQRAPLERDRTIVELGGEAMKQLLHRKRQRAKVVEVYTASMYDIRMALQRKTEFEAGTLPEWMGSRAATAFDRTKTESLPAHRLGVDHAINLKKDAQGNELQIPSSPLYKRSKEELLVLRKTLNDLLEKGLIRQSNSPISSPVLFVKKSDGSLRFCCDYRKLNEVTQGDAYPLPLIQETLRTIASARWVSKVDVIAAFHRLRMKLGDEWKTAFATRFGAFEWLVMPFGLTGAPATFQRYVNWVLRHHLDIDCSAYLDDVVIYSDGTQEEHRTLVRKIVTLLGDAGLQLDIKKCAFEAESILYLGYIIEVGKGVRMDPKKVEALRQWQSPTSVRGVRSFLGFANFYREFIPRFSEVAAPLTALTKKDLAFEWRPEAQAAFERLIGAMLKAPALAAWDPEAETIVEADASGYVVGGALLQRSTTDGLWRGVSYYSRKMTPAEANYPIHDKEMLAVVACLREWRPELTGRRFLVHSDHKNLAYFRKSQHLSERQMRWAGDMLSFDFEIKHQAGISQVLSDALSRRDQDLPKDAQDDRLRERQVKFLDEQDGLLRVHARMLQVLVTEVRHESNTRDPPAYPVDQVAATPSPTEPWTPAPFEDESLQKLWDEALLQDTRYREIFRRVASHDRRFEPSWQLAVSPSECSIDNVGRLRWRGAIWIPDFEPLRTRLIQRVHDSPLGGHPGRESTRDLLRREFIWPKMGEDVRRFVRNCDVCGRSKVWRDQKKGLLKPLPVPDRQWSELSVDFVVQLNPSDECTNIMVVTDRLTKNVIFEPMREITAASVAKALLWGVFRHHGLPRSIVSDRGPQFVSLFWAEVCKALKINRRLSTAWHPQTDGATERANQELEAYLRMFVALNQDDWAPVLPIAMVAINNRTAASTGFSPFFLTHGYHGEIVPIVSSENADTSTQKSPARQARDWLRRLADATELAQAAIAEAQEIQEHHANRHRQAAEVFRVGDRVWLRMKNIKTQRPTKKLDWLALPYRVLELVGTHAVRLDVPRGIHDVFHVDLVRRAATDPLPSQTSDAWEPLAIQIDGVDEYEVESIVGHRRRGRGWQIRVKWRGSAEPTWEPLRDVLDLEALVQYEGNLTTVPWTTSRTA